MAETSKRRMGTDKFRGWYYKSQGGGKTLVLIPALHNEGGKPAASVQILTGQGSWTVPVRPGCCEIDGKIPYAKMGSSLFSRYGVHLDLHAPGVSAVGELRFGPAARPAGDIMGPFGFLPGLECRHMLYSMGHRVDGEICLCGETYRFDGARGYVEGDRGRSFPRWYFWTQSGFRGGALMLAAAEVPVGPLAVPGVIGVIRLGREELRLATYLGARLVRREPGLVQVRQGHLELTVWYAAADDSPALRAPVAGEMSRQIREQPAGPARYRLTRDGIPLLDYATACASYESPPAAGTPWQFPHWLMGTAG